MGDPQDTRAKSYPLASLREARALSSESAQAQLAAERVRMGECDAALSAAQAALQAAGNHADASTTTGAELARAASFAALRRGTLHKALADARAAQRQQARALRLAELTWQAARVEHAIVDRHHQRFSANERKLNERAQDDEADELHAARRKL